MEEKVIIVPLEPAVTHCVFPSVLKKSELGMKRATTASLLLLEKKNKKSRT